MITDEIGGGGGGAGISGSALANLLTGYATQDWVGENYISIEFFSRLFQAHGTENGQQTDIDPNDMDSTITSIESMFGFWTDYYLSALGNGGGLGSTLYLSTLADVLISSPANNQVLTYNATTGKWVNANAQAGVTDLASLTDVLITTPSQNQVLIYDSVQAKWINTPLKTINSISIIGSGDISVGGGASGNYLPLTGGTITGTLVIDVAGTTQTNNGLYFRNPAVGAYNLSIFPYNHEATYTDGLSINGYDGISFCTGSNGRQERARFPQSGGLVIQENAPDRYIKLVSSTTRTWILMSFGGDDNIFGLYSGYQFFMSRELEVQGQISGTYLTARNGNVVLNAFEAGNTTGISFRKGYENTYNLSIFVYAHSGSAADGLSINGYGGISFCTGSNSRNERMRMTSTGNLGVGTGAPEYRLHVAGSIYATDAITALSDMREKLVNEKAELPIEWIANAPAFSYYWKDKKAHDELLHVGSSAQYWRTVLPEVVLEAKDEKGTLSMQYGVAALVSAIITARKVVDHERRISALEKENERLKTEVEQLRLN